jgi:hypothetical protein
MTPQMTVFDHPKVTVSNVTPPRQVSIGNQLKKIISQAMSEPEIRLVIQDFMDKTGCDAVIMVENNRVWPLKYLVKNFSAVIKANNMNLLTWTSYAFLSLVTGSSAHNNKYGWIDHYPSVDSLAKYFEQNEFGVPVLSYIPEWRSDALRAAKELDWMLRNRLALQALT